MASAIKNISYRTVDQLLDAVRIDFGSFQQAGDIDAAPLIKLAQKINYELGLKIYMPKETIIEINNSRAKLPADFYQLQLALLCSHYREISTAPWNGNVWLEQIVTETSGTTCDICQVTHTGQCPIVVSNPYIQGATRSFCNGTAEVKVLKYCQASVQCYENFERLYIEPTRNASAFCVNSQFKGACNTAQIVGNFIETSVDCGKIYVAYLGQLEDEEGNLLVLDHPTINLYYEYRLKKAVMENLYLNGDDMLQRLQYVDRELENYRQQALSIVNTSDFRELVRMAQVIRQMTNRRYAFPLDRFHGYISWSNPIDVI